MIYKCVPPSSLIDSFFCVVLQTCLILLEENISEQANTQFKERKDLSCSDGFMQLSTKHLYLEGRGRPVKVDRKQCN